jgi:serine/threonine-protein kinase
MIGKTLGSFVVEEEIGSGGMGVVLLARQTSLDRAAVLKRIRRDLTDFPELSERFEREARAAAQIHHQNVVAVFEKFRWRNDLYIAQEYVDGIDLASALQRTGALPWRIAGLIALEVVRGLEEIHSLGTVHRDLKPANILLGRRGEVKIADFGLALEAAGSSLTGPGIMIGSPTYMPPEQMLGERVDARCDVFSLGVILYEMLAGQLPFPHEAHNDEEQGEQAEARPTDSLLSRMQKERYKRLRSMAPRTPRRVARLIKRCLRARPRNRLSSTTELRKRLESELRATSSTDVRAELASWLWEQQLFEVRQNETVVQLVRSEGAGSTRSGWVAPLLAASLAALVAASILLVDIRSRPDGGTSTLKHGAERSTNLLIESIQDTIDELSALRDSDPDSSHQRDDSTTP